MAREFEIIGASAIGALLHRKAAHVPPPGTPCPNCGAALQGLYCHVCGQSADDHHRSIWHLLWEGIEGLTHLDGRLGQTLPPLFLNPGKLARDQLEGRRQRHVPPFRLFLISLLIFMFVLESLFHGATTHKVTAVHGQTVSIVDGKKRTQNVVFVTPTQGLALLKPGDAPKPAPGVHFSAGPPAGGLASFKVDGADTDAIGAATAFSDAGKGAKSPRARWLNTHLKRAIANQEYYTIVLFTWAHRLAILLLPILAALLALVYVRRRKSFFIYDHLIVAMQFLSFEFLIFALAWIVPDPVREWALLAATLWTPVNLYMTLRGAYGSKRLTAAVKTMLLWVSTVALFGVLMVGLLTLALAEM